MLAINKKLHSLTLLIVEDDESTLIWLSRVLSIYFKEVVVAQDAMQAIELFKQTAFDIVISDIQMPQVNGLNLLHKIYQLSPSTIRVVMTAYNTPEYINAAVESNVNFYLKKPIDIDEFLVAVASCTSLDIKNEERVLLYDGHFYYFKQKIVKKAQLVIRLTKKEVLLLELFLKKRESIVSLQEIEHTIWQEPASADAIRMVVVGIRKKLHKNIIENVKGLGYKLNID